MPGPVVVLPESRSALLGQERAYGFGQALGAPFQQIGQRQLTAALQAQFPTQQERYVEEQMTQMRHGRAIDWAQIAQRGEQLNLTREQTVFAKKQAEHQERERWADRLAKLYEQANDELMPPSQRQQMIQSLAEQLSRAYGKPIPPSLIAQPGKLADRLHNLKMQNAIKAEQEWEKQFGMEVSKAQADIDLTKARAQAAGDVILSPGEALLRPGGAPQPTTRTALDRWAPTGLGEALTPRGATAAGQPYEVVAQAPPAATKPAKPQVVPLGKGGVGVWYPDEDRLEIKRPPTEEPGKNVDEVRTDLVAKLVGQAPGMGPRMDTTEAWRIARQVYPAVPTFYQKQRQRQREWQKAVGSVAGTMAEKHAFRRLHGHIFQNWPTKPEARAKWVTKWRQLFNAMNEAQQAYTGRVLKEAGLDDDILRLLGGK